MGNFKNLRAIFPSDFLSPVNKKVCAHSLSARKVWGWKGRMLVDAVFRHRDDVNCGQRFGRKWFMPRSHVVQRGKGGWRATAENENKSRCTAIRFLKKKRSFAIPFLLLAKGWKFSVEIGVCTHEAKTLFPLSGFQTSLAFSVFPVLALWIVHSMQMKSWFRSKAPSMEIYLWIPRVYWYLRPSGEIYLFWNLDSPSFIYERAFLL